MSHIKTKKYFLFLLFWSIYALLSLVWAPSPEAVFGNIVYLVTGIVLISLVAYYFRESKDYYRAFHIWLAVLLVMIGLGLWNVITGEHLGISRLAQASYGQRFTPTAVFYNENDYATYLAMSLAFVVAFLRYTRPLQGLIGLCLLFLPLLYLLVATGSRANFFAVTIGLAIWFVLFFDWKSRVQFLFVIFPILLIGLLLLPDNISIVVTAFLDGINSMLVGLQHYDPVAGGSINVRLNLIANAFILWRETALLGVGAGNVEYCMAMYGMYDTKGIVNVHNWWVELFVNYGIFVFIVFVA